jgi:poly-beta-1,6-N-acetyl-D-glucosamine synthase
MVILFSILLLVLFYIYFFYPLILAISGAMGQKDGVIEDDRLPTVTIIVPAFNESKNIIKKLENGLAQKYPKHLYEVIVTSDGSTDDTVALARSLQDERIKVVENAHRRGKNNAINEVLKEANGEIIVFTDANALFSNDAIARLVQHFSDASVGLVCGHLKYLKGNDTGVGKGEGLYFRYESWIKRQESKWGSVSVATGSIYAIRKGLALPLSPDVANDFAHPAQVGAMGYKVIFEPGAIAYEQATKSIREEFRRRARIVTRGFTAFGKYWKSCRLLQGKRGFCFVSHKLLRWFAPFFLAGLFFSNLFLEGYLFRFTMISQLVFYGAATLGIFVRKGPGAKALAVPFYFCMINLAALIGFFSYLRGKRQTFWEVAATTR